MQHFKPTTLKKLVNKPFVKNNKINPIPVSKPIPVVVPNSLSPAQKAAALPFVQEEPVKKSKSKALGRFFKKFTKLPLDKKKSQQHKITFVPIPPQESLSSDCKNKNNQVTSTTTPKITIQEQPDSIASDYAQRIWDEDKTVYANLENVAEWIGNGKSMSNMILKFYMNKFDFKSLKLEQAFRVLCSKLHLKAETQQIDRILAAFATRYYDCNPKCIFGTSDIVHTIVYSMLLLNTDLHVAQGDYKKMSRVAFVKNTMYAITSQIDCYVPEKSTSFQSLDWIPLQRTPSNQSASSIASSTCLSSMTCDASALVFGSQAWQAQLKLILKQIYNGIRSTQVATPSTATISANNSVSAAIRRSIGSIMRRDSSFSIASSTFSCNNSSIFFSATTPASDYCFSASTCVY